MRECVSCGDKVESGEAVVSGDGVIHESCLEKERKNHGLEDSVTTKGRIAGSGYPSRWGEEP